MATQDTDSGLCPACQRKILAPQHRRCMYCGVKLPENLVLSEAESANVLREKHEKWLAETAAIEARKPKDKDAKRKKRKKTEPDESESAILLNAMAEHEAAKRKPAPVDVVRPGPAKKAVAQPTQGGDSKTADHALQVQDAEVLDDDVLDIEEVDAEKLRAARLLIARAEAAEAAKKAEAAKIAAAKLKVARLKAKLKRDG